MTDLPRNSGDLSSPCQVFVGVTESDLDAAGEPSWLWHGLLSPGNVTLLTSQWKTGKTTLLAILLSRLREGGTLLGRTLRPGRAAIVSEEPKNQWKRRRQKLSFGNGHVWFCRPLRPGRPGKTGSPCSTTSPASTPAGRWTWW